MRPNDTSREELLPLSSDPALRRRFMVVNEPIPGNLRFGVLLEVLDMLAARTSMDYLARVAPGALVVTAAVDEIVVRRAAEPTGDLRCLARINQVGRSSMEVGIRVESADEPSHVASCYFTMVAREGDGPEAPTVPLPRLESIDELEQRREWQGMKRRLAARRQAAAAAEPPTREEFVLLAGLHRAQEPRAFSGLRAGELLAESWERAYPDQENGYRVIFGGYVMRRAYELSAICAEQVATGRPVLAAVNRVNFLHPVRTGDKLHYTTRVVYTEGAAVCVEASIERMSRDRSVRALSNSCLFTFVNMDTPLAPAPVPPVYPSSYAEDARYLEARRNLEWLKERTVGRWLGSNLLARSGAGAG